MDSKVGTSDSRSSCEERKNKAGGWLESLPPSIIQRIRDNRNKYDETESVKSSLVFPPEIIQEIFLKLPISYVVQCSLVCKYFEKVSKSRNFALMHIKHGTDHNPFLIYHAKRGRGNSGSFPNYLSRLNISSMDGCVGTVQRVDIPFQDIMVDYSVIASCLGYLCLVSLDSYPWTKWALLLYNPLTGDFKELPVPSQVPNTLFAYGYGYHVGTGEYKVLMTSLFLQLQIEDNNMDHVGFGSTRKNEWLEVQILTIGTENWRILETPSCWLKIGAVGSMPEKQALWINGCLYWLTSTRRIITLDLASEKFEEITVPSGASHLLAIRGNLSAVVNNEQGSWEIWVMKDKDMPESWTRDFVLGHYMPAALRHSDSSDNDHYLKYVRVVCCLNGKFLLNYGCKAWCYYDPETELYEDLTIFGLPEEFETIAHVGSLSYLETL